MNPKPAKSPMHNSGRLWSDTTRTWHFEFRLKLGDRPSRKFNGDTGQVLETDAREWVARKKAALKNAEVGIQNEGPAMSLKDLVKLYVEKRGGSEELEEAGSVTAHTLQVIKLRARLHWKGLLETPINQITSAEVEDMRQRYLVGDGRRSKGGANKVVSTLHAVLGWAVKRGLIDRVPFKVAKLNPQKKVKAVVWPEDVRRFLRASQACRNADARVALATCMLQGLREGEALGMRWEWFDWRAQVYKVGASKNRGIRSVPMHPFWRRVMRHRWLHAGRPAVGWVLKAKDGEPHREGYLRKPTDNTARSVAIVGLHPHRLRASAATGWWESGASLAQVQQWLGHEEASTSMLYIVPRDLAGREVMARFAKASGWAEARPIPVESPNKPRRSFKSKLTNT